jgi:hypothetical protein
MFPRYSQHTCESCLAVCILQLLHLPLSLVVELDVVTFALGFSKTSFVRGHLEWLLRHSPREVSWTVDSGSRLELGRPRKLNHRLHIQRRHVSVAMIYRIALEAPCIIYVDAFAIWRRHHYPHFVIVRADLRQSRKLTVYDPWNGSEREAPISEIERGIRLLRRLRFLPQVIEIR